MLQQKPQEPPCRRKLFGWLPWFAVLLMASIAAAAPPQAVIDGPASRKQGDTFILDASKSSGEHQAWKVKIKLAGNGAQKRANLERRAEELRAAGWAVVAPTADAEELYVSLEGDKKIVLPTYPGEYTAILAVSNADGVDLAEYSLTIDGGVVPVPPGPGPQPGPVPTPVGLSALVAAEVAKVVTADTKDAWLAWASVYNGIADVSEAMKFDTVAQFLAADQIARSVPTTVSTKWQSVLENVITPQLQALSDKGGLTTVADYAKTWREIAAGVKTGAGAQPPPLPVDPVVPPAPVTDKMRVLIRYDTTKSIPAEQESILTSSPFRAQLDSLVGKGNWRIWDQTISGQDEAEQFWRDAGKLPYNSLPWLFITGGKPPGFNNKLPDNPAAALAVVKGLKP